MSPTTAEIASFYDIHSQRLLRDFIYGNLRVNAAIELVVRTLSGRSGRILDIGCGIGTTSFAYTSRLEHFSVDGVDISPKSIEIAKLLFQNDRLNFSESDMSQASHELPYDAIALVDVYEHIPCNQRADFNRVLSKSLSPQGTLILTSPSVLHQEYLRNHEPSGLQIVDEDVDLTTIHDLARDISGTVTYFAFTDVWQTNQYLHVVIERSPLYKTSLRNNTPKKSSPITKLSQLGRVWKQRSLDNMAREREQLVKARLGVNFEN